jgi:hypothetical protein
LSFFFFLLKKKSENRRAEHVLPGEVGTSGRKKGYGRMNIVQTLCIHIMYVNGKSDTWDKGEWWRR